MKNHLSLIFNLCLLLVIGLTGYYGFKLDFIQSILLIGLVRGYSFFVWIGWIK